MRTKMIRVGSKKTGYGYINLKEVVVIDSKKRQLSMANQVNIELNEKDYKRVLKKVKVII